MSAAEGGCNREQQGSKDTQSAPPGQGAESPALAGNPLNVFNNQWVEFDKKVFPAALTGCRDPTWQPPERSIPAPNALAPTGCSPPGQPKMAPKTG